MDLDRDATAIVPDLDGVALRIDGHLDHILGLVILIVVCRIYQNLIYIYFD